MKIRKQQCPCIFAIDNTLTYLGGLDGAKTEAKCSWFGWLPRMTSDTVLMVWNRNARCIGYIVQTQLSGEYALFNTVSRASILSF